jgi:membrane-bound lytic murein transglycosylase
MNKKNYLPRNFSIYDVGRLWSLIIFISLFIAASGMNSAGLETGEDFTIHPQNPEKTWEIIQSDLEDPERNGQGFPPVWDELVNTGYSHTYFVILSANPRVNDFSLEYGDWIGGFYLDDDGNKKCGGARMWNGDQAISVTLFGNSPYTSHKDGFSNGELIEFRVFLWSTQKQYTITDIEFLVAPYFVYNGRWYNMSISRILDMQSQVNLDFFINPSANPICINNQISLSAEEFVGSGGSYSFEWTSDLLGFFSNLQNPPPLTLDQTTLFSLQVTDGIDTSNHSLTVVVHDHPSVIAGENIVKCVNATIQLSGQAQNALNTEWVTSGDGTFCDPMNINAVYTPGDQDKVNGSVILTLLAEPLSPCTFIDSDALTVTLAPLPTVFAGNDMSACGNDIVMLQAIVSDFSAVEWFSSGDGTFTEKYELETQYLPAGNDITNGVTLTICAEPISPCVLSICDEVSISYLPGPTANAPDILRLCENQNINVSANVTNNSGVLWTTQGDGSFGDPNQLNTYYTPGLQDIENDGTVITIEALPIAPCEISAFKNINLEIQKLPRVIDFGPNTNYMCKNNLFVQLNAVVQEYTTLSWSTSGDGFFTSLTNPVTRYYPGSNDKATGQFTLTITANPKQFCQVQTIESKTINIVDNPNVTITSSVNSRYCEDDTLILQADANFYSNLQWLSSGDGTFILLDSLSANYIPGAMDISTGSNVTITLLASPISPCTVADQDIITTSFQKKPIVDAGGDVLVCQGQTVLLAGTADAYSAVFWETNGDGTFNNSNILNPVYTPGVTDIASGQVQLTLIAEAISPCTVAEFDQMTIYIQHDAIANAGSDVIICENQNITLNGQAENYSTVEWTTLGTGTFTNPNSLSATYVPSVTDINTGSVVLLLTAEPISPCQLPAIDQMTLTFQMSALANAGADAEICQGNTHQLQGVVSNASSLQWTTSGSGTFSSSGIINPVYTPSQADINSGSVTLILTAASVSPCNIFAQDELTLSIQQLATANAGANATICENSTFTLNGQAAHYTTLQWTTSGNGNFNNTGILNPVYNPSVIDINTGQVVLTLTAQPVSPCVVSASDDMTLNIQKLSTANAGADAEICEGNTHQLQGVVSNASSLQWTTSGSGAFSNAGIINPVYTPSQADINSGSVTLILTAASVSPCNIFAQDELTLSIQQLATANAGANATICENSNFTLNGQAAHYTTLQWTTSGNGNFNNTGILNPVYNPSVNDINSGQVVLTLTAQPVSPCVVSASDAMTLNIQKLSTANAGADAEICQGNTHQLQGVVSNASSLQWTTSGSGAFSNAGIINPVYTPSQADINSGSVTLILTAASVSPCNIFAQDELTLSIQQLATANAGANATICENSNFTLNGQAAHYTTLQWTTSGNGNFNNTGILNPVYNPSVNDINSGQVVLTLTAQPVSPCVVSASDAMTLNIQKLSTANAGADAEICEGQHPSSFRVRCRSCIIGISSGVPREAGAFSMRRIFSIRSTHPVLGRH